MDAKLFADLVTELRLTAEHDVCHSDSSGQMLSVAAASRWSVQISREHKSTALIVVVAATTVLSQSTARHVDTHSRNTQHTSRGYVGSLLGTSMTGDDVHVFTDVSVSLSDACARTSRGRILPSKRGAYSCPAAGSACRRNKSFPLDFTADPLTPPATETCRLLASRLNAGWLQVRLIATHLRAAF